MYKRQAQDAADDDGRHIGRKAQFQCCVEPRRDDGEVVHVCLLYTSDAADERSSVDLGGRRIIKKKKLEIKLAEWSSEKRLQSRRLCVIEN